MKTPNNGIRSLPARARPEGGPTTDRAFRGGPLVAVAAILAGLPFAVAGSQVSAQDRPDFTGSWTLSESSGGMAPRGAAGSRGAGMRGVIMRGGLGGEVTIAQDERTLTIARFTPQGYMRSAYDLDGTESFNAVPAGGNQVEVGSTATWQGTTLWIVTPDPFGGSGETRLGLALSASGDLMVEWVRTDGPGGGGEPIRGTYVRVGGPEG